jgi:hypothetical protein
MCSFSSLIRAALFLSPLPQGERGKANPFSRSVSSRVLPSYESSCHEAKRSNPFPTRNDSFRLASSKQKGSGAPKGALSYQFPRIARLRVAFQQRARLSALTLAALATGYYPDGSAPEPGFPRRPLTGVSPVSPTKRKRNAAVKHAPCGPVFVPVDRGPEAARERIGKNIRARAPHLAFAVSACRPERRPAQSEVSMQ